MLRDTAFTTSDSAADKRLDGHKYQGVVVSYQGVPILGDDGGLVGTLCHFDTEAHPISDNKFELLQGAAHAIPSRLLQGPVPRTDTRESTGHPQ